jgi:hypothetical protein
VQDGYRAAAEASRPAVDMAAVPSDALRQPPPAVRPASDGLVLVRITYGAVERDTWSADDPIQRQGSGVLFLDRSGRTVVVTARSLVDAAFTETDTFGGDPDIEDEQIKVMLASGTVLRAGRVWVDPNGQDIAALVLEEPPPDMVGTPAAKLVFAGAVDAQPLAVRAVGADGAALPAAELSPTATTALPGDASGAAVTAGDRAVGVLGMAGKSPVVVAFELLPADLRPQ